MPKSTTPKPTKPAKAKAPKPVKAKAPKSAPSKRIDDIHTGRTNLFKLARKHLTIDAKKALNPRIEFGDIDTLAQQIAEHGIITALQGSMQGAKFAVSHGERRLAAYDLAVEKYKLDPKGPKGLIPVLADPQEQRGFSDKDRIVRHVVLNNSKPLDAFEVGRAAARLVDEFKMSAEAIGTAFGYSKTAIINNLKLINDASPEVQKLVSEGKMSSTTAIEVVRETKGDKDQQKEIVGKAGEAAEKAGKKVITAAHIPIAIGKAAQAGRKAHQTSMPIFAGKTTTPDTPTTDSKGNFITHVQKIPLSIGAKGVNAQVFMVRLNNLFYSGYLVTWPGVSKLDGYKNIPPSLTKGLKADTEQTAHLLALQAVRAELEAHEFTSRPDALADMDSLIKKATEGLPVSEPKKPDTKPLANPVLPLETPDKIKELQEALKAIDPTQAEKDRLNPVKKVMQFLTGKMDAKQLTRWLLGID